MLAPKLYMKLGKLETPCVSPLGVHICGYSSAELVGTAYMYNNLKRTTKQKYYENLLNESKYDIRKTWKIDHEASNNFINQTITQLISNQ